MRNCLISARIPHQSENHSDFSDSFPPGEALGAPAPEQRTLPYRSNEPSGTQEE